MPLAMMECAIGNSPEVTLAAAATVNLAPPNDTADSNRVYITGTGTISSFGIAYGFAGDVSVDADGNEVVTIVRPPVSVTKTIRFAAGITIQHNPPNITLLSGINRVTLANDEGTYTSDLAGHWTEEQFHHISQVSALYNVQELTVAAAATTNLAALDTNRVHVTASAPISITSFGPGTLITKRVRFDANITIVYNAVSLQLIGRANRITQVSDVGTYTVDQFGHWVEEDFRHTDTDPSAPPLPPGSVSIPIELPIGSIIIWPGATVPVNFFECNGATVARTAAPLLAAVLDPGGSAPLVLPDLRGEFIRGWDHGRGVDAGRAIKSAQADVFKAHSHTYTRTDSTTLVFIQGDGTYTAPAVNTQVVADTSTVGNAIETRPRNIALMYIIRYQ